MLQSLGLGKFPLSDGHWNEPGDVVGVVVATGVVSNEKFLVIGIISKEGQDIDFLRRQETKSGEVQPSKTGSKIESPGQV